MDSGGVSDEAVIAPARAEETKSAAHTGGTSPCEWSGASGAGAAGAGATPSACGSGARCDETLLARTPVVLVTGGSGYVGQFITAGLAASAKGETFARAPRAYRVVSTFCRRRFECPGCTTVQLDITDRGAVDAVIKKWRPSVVVNCAAISTLRVCETQPDKAMKVNAIMVYDGRAEVYREGEHKEHPMNVYGRTKLACEQLLRCRWPRHVCLRTSNVLGPPPPFLSDDYNKSFIQWVCDRFRSGETTDVVKVIQHFTLKLLETEALDLTGHPEALGQSGQVRLPVMYHMGGPVACSRLDIAKAVAAATGLAGTVPKHSGELASGAGLHSDPSDRPEATAESLTKTLISPSRRADVDLGYATPLVVCVDSSALEAEVGFAMQRPKDVIGLIAAAR